MSAQWIWFPGDFEIYHGMLQNFQREERGYGWPAYWRMDDWRKNVRFFRNYALEATARFTVHGLSLATAASATQPEFINARASKWIGEAREWLKSTFEK